MASQVRRFLIAIPILCCSLGATQAQRSIHARWSSMEYVLRPTGHGRVELFAAPFTFGHSAGPALGLARLGLESVPSYQWTSVLRAAVDSLEHSTKPSTLVLIGPPLPASGGRAFLVIGYDPARERNGRYFLLLEDSVTGRDWRVGATTTELRALLNNVEAAAQESGLVTPAAPDSVAPAPCAGAGAGACDPPRPRLVSAPPLRYPYGARIERKTGGVWLEFDVDTAGLVDSASVEVIKADAADLADAAVLALLKARFAPSAVKTRTYWEFHFSLSCIFC